jgi:hypothetical protein
MAIQEINIGNLVNDGTGDDLRTAFRKVNENFTSLSNELAVTGQNLGSGSEIFVEKTNNILKYRSISAGPNISVTENTNDIEIGTTLQNVFSSIVTNNGTVIATNGADTLQLLEGSNVNIQTSGKSITISADLINAQLTGPLDLNGQSIIGTGTINISGNVNATNFIGNYGGASQVSILGALFDNDFGGINQDPQNAVQALYQISDYDFGTVLAPSDNEVDLGTII